MVNQSSLKVKLFADGAQIDDIRTLAADPKIQGFTTNPTLMRKAGIADYVAFSKEAIGVIGDRPISLEVFSDDLPEMVKQARFLASLGDNVYVKIPVTNTLAASTAEVVRQLSSEGVKVNVTALTTVQQVREVAAAIAADVPACISVFAGRIADTGIDPLPTMVESVALLADRPSIELIWASPRELLNVVQASEIGCHIITVTTDLLKKLPLLGTDLLAYSLDTVKMFASDAQAAGYVLDV